MELVVNGIPRIVADSTTVRALLELLALDPRRVAVERNRDIVRRAEWDSLELQPDDRLEIVELVGGGR